MAQPAHMLEAGPSLAVELERQGHLTKGLVDHRLLSHPDPLSYGVQCSFFYQIGESQKVIGIKVDAVAQVVQALFLHQLLLKKPAQQKIHLSSRQAG